jgi:thioesterase domain-containing protein
VSDDILDLATTHVRTAIPVLGHMDLRVVEVGPGVAATEVPFDGNGNHVGTMYAGVLFSVAEVLGGILGTSTFDGSRFAPIVKGADIRYLRPARTGVRARTTLAAEEIARVTAEADANGKADYVLETEIVDEDGTLVATLRGDYQLRKR